MYEDPVKRTEREIDELIALQKAEFPPLEAAPEPDTADIGPDGGVEKVEGEPQAKPVEAKPVPVEDPNSDTFKARWETLQGKYTSELGRANTEIRRLATEVTKLQQQMVAAPKPAEAKPASVEEALDTLEQEYGQKFVQAMDARVGKLVDGKLDERLKPVQERVAQYETQNAQTAQSTYETELTRLCPGWRTQDNDQGFIDWIGTNRIGLKSIQDLLVEAHQTRNPQAVADIFNWYSRSQPAPQPDPKPNPAPGKPTPEALIVPNAKGSGDHAKIEASQGKTITMAQIDAFYKRMELGKVDAKEAAAFEAEIHKANMEGRITG
jgi:hypothetical protein